MIMTIYDYDNTAVEVELLDKPIAEIYVCILSGDETGNVTFEDGENISFDASSGRIWDFYDGSYRVRGDVIREWIDFKPTDGETASYERIEMFGGEG